LIEAAGFQLGKVQVGLDPDDWKPFDDVGAGAVLHCFQKKTQATSKQDKALAEACYRAMVNARMAQK
jgi:phage-related protein